MSEQVWWYATRAAGMMTWTTATASVVLGLLLSTKKIRARTGPWFLDLHRFLGGVSVVFLIAHIVTLWADGYVDFGPRELFVPGASEWKPEAVAWGIVAAYLLIAVEVTSLLRARLGNTVWRAVHFSSFAAMIGGSYHAFLAGSDVDNPITWVIAGIGSVLVMGLVSMRLQRQDPDEAGSARRADNRAILEEMRQRLQDLPTPETTPRPRISSGPSSSLPRRATVSSDPFADMAGDPFGPVEPTPTAIHVPAVAPQPATSAGGPPPLPSAIDPVTGEPDEAAYTAWLKDWLAYAEQYGDETPDDPARQ